ncbi:TPA: hypothetical protein IUW36_001583 [Enterococcus faecalis]|uniref:hypothetical protein n=1 Tax=Enterococcus faecalis TaxID=1351 RepID=UPI000BD4B261|nr:hypothetical protein [Enterococcus faecalis]MCE2549452.1 hypothetical protein [Enterococcus faecalis]PCP68622.1 hypothetical protein CQA23_14325 [Enterococcus faecalis]RRQ90433.1 hypothetical protein CUR49_12500 [Enterococcus faecalis]RRQ97852.1 hypothetical protein CUR52_03175 [Enterococcus faecalis]UJQ90960.1 hypothetical protein L2629_04640 [Enterococcus faecalis]
MNLIKIDDGIFIDGTKINYLTNVAIHSGIENLSEITLTFLGKVDGLDNVQNNFYQFKSSGSKEYKPSRKYLSR